MLHSNENITTFGCITYITFIIYMVMEIMLLGVGKMDIGKIFRETFRLTNLNIS